jgi:hypothetical protein
LRFAVGTHAHIIPNGNVPTEMTLNSAVIPSFIKGWLSSSQVNKVQIGERGVKYNQYNSEIQSKVASRDAKVQRKSP